VEAAGKDVEAAGKVELLAPLQRDTIVWRQQCRQVVPAQAREGWVSETLEHLWSAEDESQNSAGRTRSCGD
jgi:hypothetical protein